MWSRNSRNLEMFLTAVPNMEPFYQFCGVVLLCVGLLLKFTWVNLVLASRMDLSNYLIFECQKLFVCSTRLHPKVERAVGVGFQPGLQPAKVVSAFQAGDIQFLDMRNLKEAYLTIDAHRGSLTSLVVHRHAPLIASGSSKKLYLNIKGSDLLSAETNGNQKNLFLHLSFLLAFSSYFFF
ncbi:hypothetical protein HAX54_001433 [Datura stramonium]|uniref:Uncharacterized protein n=1 Tax=Datura stramonium TaxID=4076 RepID=A0ABS8WUM5_DATST|nr:hypothetical protein [Datura stramonium]